MLRYATALQSANQTQRRAAVKELCRLGSAVPPSALNILLPLLQDQDETVRDGASEALGNVGRGGLPDGRRGAGEDRDRGLRTARTIAR
jgi:HEAT repeat protein